jgi:hypothetical protein
MAAYHFEIRNTTGTEELGEWILPLSGPAIFRAAVTPQDGPGIYLFELSDANLGTYSSTRFVKAATAGEIADRIRENTDCLDEIAVVSVDVPPTSTKAHSVVMTAERTASAYERTATVRHTFSCRCSSRIAFAWSAARRRA